MRNLMGRPPMTDAFGKSGRVWLSGVDLPRDERQTVDGCLRQIDFLNEEVAILEREIALHSLDSAEIKRLMTVPGVSLMTPRHSWQPSATLLASRARASSSAISVSTRESASPAARRLGTDASPSKALARPARCSPKQHSFRSARRGRCAPSTNASAPDAESRSLIAVARKLVVLFWHMLTRDEDYAFARPSLTAHKLRELELRAGAERRVGSRSLRHKSGYHQQPNRDRERELSAQAELAYRRLVTDWKRANPERTTAKT